jgi:hypothetical protein
MSAPWQCSPWPRPPLKVVILVVILTFVVILAVLGYAPAVAIGVAVVAMTAASDPGAARAALEI